MVSVIVLYKNTVFNYCTENNLSILNAQPVKKIIVLIWVSILINVNFIHIKTCT